MRNCKNIDRVFIKLLHSHYKLFDQIYIIKAIVLLGKQFMPSLQMHM